MGRKELVYIYTPIIWYHTKPIMAIKVVQYIYTSSREGGKKEKKKEKKKRTPRAFRLFIYLFIHLAYND